MNIRKFLFTEDEFIFEIDVVKFRSILSSGDFPKFTSKFENGQYNIESKLSVGILIINDYKGFSIATNAKLSGDSQKTIVNLSSSFRPEYLFILFAFLFFMVIAIVKDFGFNILWIPGIFVVAFFWFKMILQSQEETLHQNIKKYFQDLE